MLVLTRRENEKILLPDVGVTVELMAVTGNRARLGISAPDNIRILREEVAASQDAIKHAMARGPVSREFAHALRNRLNAAILGAETVRLQVEAGHLAETSATLDRIVAELRAMASMLQGKSPAPLNRSWREAMVRIALGRHWSSKTMPTRACSLPGFCG